MRRFMLFMVVGILLIVAALPVGATGGVRMYHYDYFSQALIANYGMPDEASIALDVPSDKYVQSFGFNEAGSETIFCYSNGTDPATMTLVRRDLLTGTNLWSMAINGHECGLGQGSYSADGLSFAMGIIYVFPWDGVMTMGSAYEIGLYSVATGAMANALDVGALTALDTSVGWLPVTYLNEPGRVRFKMEPRGTEGGGYDGRMFEWDTATTLTELDATAARGNTLVTTWGEVFWPQVDPTLATSESYIAYLRPSNTVKLSYMGDIPRTVYHSPTAVITQVDPIGQDGITITYIKNSADPAASTYLYERVNLMRDGTLVGPYGETDQSYERVWFMPEMGYANYTDFPTFGDITALAAPPLSEPPVFSDANTDAYSYHYDFDTQSLISNYMGSISTAYPLGVPVNRYISSFAIDPTGNAAIYCYEIYETDPMTVVITSQDIVSGTVAWTQTIEAKSCSLGQGSISDDGKTFAMSLVFFDTWDDIPLAAGPYPYTYGLYDTSNGTLVNQLDMNYVPLGDLTQVYQMSTFSNNASGTIFAARQRVIEGPSPSSSMYRWDGEFAVSEITNERGVQGALVLPWGEVFWPEEDASLPVTESYVPYGGRYNVVKQNVGGVTRTIYHTATSQIMQVSPVSSDGIMLTLLTNPTASEGAMYEYTFFVLNRDGSSYGGFPVLNNFPTLVWVRNQPVTAAFYPDFVVSAASAPIPPAPPLATMTCPGFMPSRLSVGGRGRVTPGEPNNVRDNPATTGIKIGEIPGGAAFDIVTGPVCDPAGRAWWQVVYAGITGWTVEGQGSIYWTEPLP